MVQKVWKTIATATVSKNAFDARHMCFLRDSDRIVMNRDQLVEEAKKEALRMSVDGFHQTAPKPVKVTGISGRGRIGLYDFYHAQGQHDQRLRCGSGLCSGEGGYRR
ncbi:MAG: hypothetical protein ACLU9S_05175 [Oscillospiraceae bacterium]